MRDGFQWHDVSITEVNLEEAASVSVILSFLVLILGGYLMYGVGRISFVFLSLDDLNHHR